MYVKIKIAKHVIEVKQYEKLNTRGADQGKETEYGESQNYRENYLDTVRRRRETVRDLAIMNFDVGSAKFITLTFRNNEKIDIRKPQECNKEFKKFIQRLRRRYEGFKYLAVIEFQDKNDRGAVHYHMLIDLPYVPAKEIEQLWGLGFIKVNAIDKVDNLGAYISKYMTKDNADERLQCEKGYFCSKGLLRPKIYKSWDLNRASKRQGFLKALQMVEQAKAEKKEVYHSEYDSTYTGQSTYSQFNTKRQKKGEK